ncbi:uncharacterized protein LOC143841016 [Paroedura picta]|uniref:uncharacterized protein LOC143841016 n=1 Tax=Paroedura picta TaxID=143630 RepID=UPI00405600F0
MLMDAIQKVKQDSRVKNLSSSRWGTPSGILFEEGAYGSKKQSEDIVRQPLQASREQSLSEAPSPNKILSENFSADSDGGEGNTKNKQAHTALQYGGTLLPWLLCSSTDPEWEK